MDRCTLALAASAVTGLVCGASAAPFAANVTESGGNVTFRLNEPADEVIVIRDGTPTSLGALGAGSHTFARSGAIDYAIVARKTSIDGYQTDTGGNTAARLLLTDDTNVLNQFERGVGMAINNNPATPALFGRMYVSVPLNAPTISGRPLTQGVFILNNDHTESIPGQGATGLTGGIDFAEDPTYAAVSPWRLALDESGNVYIGDWSDTIGTIYRTGPDVGTSGGANLFVGTGGIAPIAPSSTLNHGSNAALAITGSPATGNLTVYSIDEDLTTTGTTSELNSLWRHDLGSTTANFDGIPTRLSGHLIDFTEGIVADLARSNDGKFYMSQNRFNGTEPGVFVVASDGVTRLYDSLSDTLDHGLDSVDILRLTRNIAVSPDGRYLAVATTNGGDVFVVPLLAGVPDLSNRLRLDAFDGSSNDAVAFDAAGNLAVVNRSDELLRKFSPGGLSLTALSNGNSGGSFAMDPTFQGAGAYASPANWLGGVVANGVNHVARLRGGNINVASPITLGAIKFDNSNVVLSGASITLRGGSPNVIVLAGSQTISAPLVLTQSSGFFSNNALTISDLQVNPGPEGGAVEIFAGGSGVVAFNRIAAESLYVTQGTTRIIPAAPAGPNAVKRLRIAGGTAPIAKLDISNSAWTIDYSDTSPLPTIRADRQRLQRLGVERQRHHHFQRQCQRVRHRLRRSFGPQRCARHLRHDGRFGRAVPQDALRRRQP